MMKKKMDIQKYANIMVLGQTGVGKSTFINYLLGREVCATGIGCPVTSGFDTYEFESVGSGSMKGLPLRIYDSKGLEVKDYQTIKKDILDFLSKKCNSDNIHEWIHSIFYCINIKAASIVPEEIEFIKEINRAITQTVHIILTNCDQSEKGKKEREKMTAYIGNQLKDSCIHVYCVNSAVTKTRLGQTYPQFGREAILEQILELLWSDIARKVAENYAEDLYGGVTRCIDKAEHHLIKVVNDIDTFKIMNGFFKDDDAYVDDYLDELFEREWEVMERDLEKIKEELKEKYQLRLKPLTEFCNEYGIQMGYEIKIYDPFDFIESDFFDIDEDKVLRRTTIGKFLDELESVDVDDLWEIIKSMGNAIGFVIRWKKHVKSFIRTYCTEICESIPNKYAIEYTVYTALIRGYTSRPVLQ